MLSESDLSEVFPWMSAPEVAARRGLVCLFATTRWRATLFHSPPFASFLIGQTAVFYPSREFAISLF